MSKFPSRHDQWNTTNGQNGNNGRYNKNNNNNNNNFHNNRNNNFNNNNNGPNNYQNNNNNGSNNYNNNNNGPNNNNFNNNGPNNFNNNNNNNFNNNNGPINFNNKNRQSMNMNMPIDPTMAINMNMNFNMPTMPVMPGFDMNVNMSMPNSLPAMPTLDINPMGSMVPLGVIGDNNTGFNGAMPMAIDPTMAINMGINNQNGMNNNNMMMPGFMGNNNNAFGNPNDWNNGMNNMKNNWNNNNNNNWNNNNNNNWNNNNNNNWNNNNNNNNYNNPRNNRYNNNNTNNNNNNNNNYNRNNNRNNNNNNNSNNALSREDELHRREVEQLGGQHYHQHASALNPEHLRLNMPYLPEPTSVKFSELGLQLPQSLIGLDYSLKYNSSQLHQFVKQKQEFKDFIAQSRMVGDYLRMKFISLFEQVDTNFLRPTMSEIFKRYDDQRVAHMKQWAQTDLTLARKLCLTRLLEEKAKKDVFNEDGNNNKEGEEKKDEVGEGEHKSTGPTTDNNDEEAAQVKELGLPPDWAPSPEDLHEATKNLAGPRQDLLFASSTKQKTEETSALKLAIQRLSQLITDLPLSDLVQPLSKLPSHVKRDKMASIYSLVRLGGPCHKFEKHHFPVSGLVRRYFENMSQEMAKQVVNTTFHEQDTTLAHRAAWNGDKETLQVLIDFGAMTNRFNIYSELPSAVAYSSMIAGKITQYIFSRITRVLNYNMMRGAQSSSQDQQIEQLLATHRADDAQDINGVQVTQHGSPQWVNSILTTQLERLKKVRKIHDKCNKSILALTNSPILGKQALIRKQETILKKTAKLELAKVEEAVHANAKWVHVTGIPFSYPIHHIIEWFKASGKVIAVHFPLRSKKSFSNLETKEVTFEEEIEVPDIINNDINNADKTVSQPKDTNNSTTTNITATQPSDDVKDITFSLADAIDNVNHDNDDDNNNDNNNNATNQTTHKMKKVLVTKTQTNRTYTSITGDQDVGHGGKCIILFDDTQAVDNALKYDFYPLLGRTIRVTRYRLSDAQREDLKWRHDAAALGVEFDDAFRNEKLSVKRAQLRKKQSDEKERLDAMSEEEKAKLEQQRLAKIQKMKNLYKERVQKRNDAVQEALRLKQQQKSARDIELKQIEENNQQGELFQKRTDPLDNVIPLDQGYLSNDPQPRWYSHLHNNSNVNDVLGQTIIYFLHLPYEYSHTDILDLIKKETNCAVKRWAMPLRQLKVNRQLDMNVLVNCAIDRKWIHTCKMVVQFNTAMDASKVLLALDGFTITATRKDNTFEQSRQELEKQREERRVARSGGNSTFTVGNNNDKSIDTQGDQTTSVNTTMGSTATNTIPPTNPPQLPMPISMDTSYLQPDSITQVNFNAGLGGGSGVIPQPYGQWANQLTTIDPYLMTNTNQNNLPQEQPLEPEKTTVDVILRTVRRLTDIKLSPSDNKAQEQKFQNRITEFLSQPVQLNNISTTNNNNNNTVNTTNDNNKKNHTTQLNSQDLQATLIKPSNHQVNIAVIGRNTEETIVGQKRTFYQLADVDHNDVKVPIHSETTQKQINTRRAATEVQTRANNEKRQRLGGPQGTSCQQSDGSKMVTLDHTTSEKEEGEVEDEF